MENLEKRYIFPQQERELSVKIGLIMLPLELILHGLFIGISIYRQNSGGVLFSAFWALFFGFFHWINLRSRKYCLAKWSFDGTTIIVFVKDTSNSIDIHQTFCVAATDLAFARRYSQVTYPFIMIWKPGARVPYEKMGGYSALKYREALILPYDEETIALFHEHLGITEIPRWPKARVYSGKARQENSV